MTDAVLRLAAALSFAFQCPDGAPPPCRAAAPAVRPAASALSIAVLPFESRSPDTTDAYLAEGLTDEVANRLTRLGRLQVKSRGQVRAQWQRSPEPIAVARGLGVSWFVHGNVRRLSGQLLVNVELVRAGTGEEAWAARFPRRDDDVFAVQAEIAESVAVIVGGRLHPREQASIARRPTRSNEAYRLYLYGNSLLGRRTEREAALAVASYERAAQLDPSFAAVWGRLSITRGIQASWGWADTLGPDSLLGLALANARRAIALDSTSADAWLGLAYAEASSGRMDESRDAFERSVRIDSMNAEAYHLYGASLYGSDCQRTCLHQPDLARPLLRRALALDPSLRNSWRHLGVIERDAGRLAESEAAFDSALAFGPWAVASENRAFVRYLRGNATGAQRDAEAADDTVLLGAVLPLLRGDSAGARSLLARLSTDSGGAPVRLMGVAVLSMALGLRNEALTALEQHRAVPQGRREPVCDPGAACSANIATWRLLHNPIFAPVRNDPRFQRLRDDTRPRASWLAGSDR